MPLWGKDTDAESRPKFLPIDSNAQGSGGSRQDAIAVAGGWGLAPGFGNSGNDNKAAQPEVLVCIRNLVEVFGSATPVSIGWTEGAVADTGTFDITVTFDEAVDVTSAAWSANQTVTNKAYILLSRLGSTDMVEDSTMMCSYYSGTGSNQIVFRGTAQTSSAGFLGFNGSGVGDTAAEGRTAIVFNGSADIAEEDGGSILGLMQESGSRDTHGDKIVLNGTDGSSTNAGDEIHMEGVDFTIAGSTATADITDLTMTGGDSAVYIGLLEDGASDGQGEDKLILNGTDSTSANANDGFSAEDYTSDIVVYTQAGSSTGTASVLNGVTVAAS
ncbi:MAG: hypothetical protein QF535_10960 [Anaerolineales bacterium]|nr:hypothetical protein [Anaerolineales bacterium]